jgi:hypothetical protein
MKRFARAYIWPWQLFNQSPRREVMTDNSIVCTSRAAAFAGLETIANSMARGTQRDSLIAIKDWIEETLPADFSEETRARLQKIFEGSEEQKRPDLAGKGDGRSGL